MKYLFLAYQNPGVWEAMPARKRDEFSRACLASEAALQDAGYLLAWGSLLEGETVTVRKLNGEISLSEGSSSQAEMRISEIFLINARDLNEAIRVASRMPQVRRGPVEIKLLVAFLPV